MSEGFGGELERILTAIGEQHQRKVEKAKAVLGRLGPKSLGMASLSWVKGSGRDFAGRRVDTARK
jgi:hypothetical protein